MIESEKAYFVLVGLVGLIALTGMTPAAKAQCQFPKLTASDGTARDQFGISVAVSGDVALVGARWDDDNDPFSGSAYVFRWNGSAWVQEQKLLAHDGAFGDNFGVSVAVSGEVALIGADLDDDRGTNSGSAYMFKKMGGVWTQIAKLTAADGAAKDRFSRSVAISGDTAVIGAYGDDDLGNRSGSAYVFEKIDGGWTQVAKLTASDGAANDSFGISVAVSGSVAVTGAPGDDDNGSGSGSVYVFEKFAGIWTQTDKLTASDGAEGDSFGGSVSISDGTTVIGASGDESAYVFEKIDGGWTQFPKLTASDGAEGDYFGRSVAISSNTAVIGASRGDEGCSLGITPCDSGSAYVFEKIGGVWTQVAKLTASDGAGGDFFGTSVAISGDTAEMRLKQIPVSERVVIGAHRDDDACPGDLQCDSGSAYVFALSPPVVDTDGDGILDVCDPCPLDNPNDADGDSVCESVDACPDTPTGVPVNGCGCTQAGACCTPTECGEFTPEACLVFSGIYQGDGSMCSEGCAFGDLDGDGDVDLVDFGVFMRCFTGAGGDDPTCSEADIDGCGSIDLDDFTAFWAARTGPIQN